MKLQAYFRSKTITKFLVFTGVFLTGNSGFSQGSGNDTANIPYWIDMAQDPSVNYYQTVRAFDLYWENRPKVPHSGYKVFERWKEYWSHHIDSAGNFEAPDKNINAWINYNGGAIPSRNSGFGLGAATWVEKGPFGLPNTNIAYPTGIGRINIVAFHPSDTNLIMVGAPQGGAWKSTDQGQSWTPMTDDLPTLGASAIVWDIKDPKTILLGTGDRDFNDAQGLGVYKSTDGGATWKASNKGMGVFNVNTLVQNPVNPNSIIAGTRQGIFYSADKGENWQWIFTGPVIKDMKYHPTDTNYVYGTYAGYFMRSTDGGQTWTNISDMVGSTLPKGNTITRYVIGVCHTNPNLVYLLASVGAGYGGLYLSTDKGLTFRKKSSTPDILEGQTFYNMGIVVDRDSSNVIYTGGINVFVSRDTGATWKRAGDWTAFAGTPKLHADHHWMLQHPITKKIITACDGGLFYRKQNGQWQSMNGNLGISQMYKIGQSVRRADRVIAGYQDNGTGIYDSRFGSNEWTLNLGADGMECILDYKDSNVWYGEQQYGNIMKNGTMYAAPGEASPWVTNYILHNTDNSVMFVARQNLWRNKKMTGSFALAWEKLTVGTNVNCIDVHNCRSNSNILYYSRGFGQFIRTRNCLATPVKFDTMTIPTGKGDIVDIETSYTDTNIVYAVHNLSSVYMSMDQGKTWVAYDSGLPKTTVFCIMSDKYAKRGLYCGTFNGVFYRDSTMPAWVLYSDGLPVGSAIRELEQYYDAENTKNCRISAATYGRGLWQSPPHLIHTAPEANFKITDTFICTGITQTLQDLTTGNPDFWQWTITPAGYNFVNGTNANSQNPQIQFYAPGNYSVKLFTRRNGYGHSTMEKKQLLKVGAQSQLRAKRSKDSICFADTAFFTATGGNGIYTWTPSEDIIITSDSTAKASPKNTTMYTVRTGSGSCKDSFSFTLVVNKKPQLSTSGNDSICAENSAKIQVYGADKYVWKPMSGLNKLSDSVVNASPKTSTTYTITGSTIFGCTDSVSVYIHIKPKINITLLGQLKICKGLGTELQASGGDSYHWSPATGLSATIGANIIANPDKSTSYMLVAEAATSCADTLNFDVDVVENPTPKINPNVVGICKGDSIVLLGSGGNYLQWTPALGLNKTDGDKVVAKPVKTTTYRLIVTNDALCKDSTMAFVEVYDTPEKILGDSFGICEGNSVVLDAQNPGFSYVWSTGETTQTIVASVSGEYTVKIFNTKCSVEDTFYVHFENAEIPVIYLDKNTLQSSAAQSYQWYFSSTAIPNETGHTHTPKKSGYYRVKVLDSNGCEAFSDSLLFELPPTEIKVYPNPTDGVLFVEIPEGSHVQTFIVYDAIGQAVLRQQAIDGSTNALSLDHFSRGIYFLALKKSDGTKLVFKVLLD